MNLDISTWKEFRVGDLFECKTTKPYIVSELENGDIPYITRTSVNNGCDAYITAPEDYINDGNCITIGAEGLYAFYQPNNFVAGVKVYTLRNPKVSKYAMFMICSVLNQDIYKYSYGRARILDKIKDEIIKLPATPTGDPDWQFMEDYIKTLHHKPLTTKNKPGQTPDLNVQNWGEFKIVDIFPVLVKGKCGDASSLIEGADVNYIGAKYNDNGVMKSCSKYENSDFINDGNCIAMIGQGQGSAGYAIYLDSEFIGATSLNLGYADWINPYTAHFVTTILCQEYDKYSFGRSWTGDRLKETIIKLPVTPTGDPDWQFMENYIKSLPYGDRI